MKYFYTVTVPHKDIIEGKLTLDVFAADLWEVYKERSPLEYRDKQIFFEKTFITQGMDNIMNVVEKRLKGDGGDSVIQLQTPFGGGKTHTLITLYHKAREWNANTVVLVGTAISPEETLWEQLELQLTGKISLFKGKISPGKETIRNLLEKHQPLLVLIDEILVYVVKAAGVKIEDSNLATQTMAFLQELTEVAQTLEKVNVIISLPSSVMEHYDEKGEMYFQKIEKISKRVEKIYEPVHENEIAKVIRQRLFSKINEIELEENVKNIIEYMEDEDLIPEDYEVSEYRDRFIESYPFQPEVIDVLYHRWGSFSKFQRTRGVLRLLSLMIHSLVNKNIYYISVGDFNLSNSDIKRELLSYIGNEYDSVISADITGVNSGSKKINKLLGDAYTELKLASRTATSIFLYSFSGGKERGVQHQELKRISTTLANPSNVITESLEKMKSKLFYLQVSDDKYYFDNQPNLNRIVLTKMDNVKEIDIEHFEKNLIKDSIGNQMKAYIWPERDTDVPDNEELKLIILREPNEIFMKGLIDNKGMSPRVNRNTIFFVVPNDLGRISFNEKVKKLLAYENIQNDLTLSLNDQQKKIIKDELSKTKVELKTYLKDMYRLVYMPNKDGLYSADIGSTFVGDTRTLDGRIHESLRDENYILSKISPIFLEEKYLKQNTQVPTYNIYQSFLKTPGETRLEKKDVFIESIKIGVKNGNFGLGIIEDNKPICKYFKEDVTPTLDTNEVLMSKDISHKQEEEITPKEKPSQIPPGPIEPKPNIPQKDEVKLDFLMPPGTASDISGILRLLRERFEKVQIIINASEGKMAEEEYKNTVIETMKSLKTKRELFR